jgi:Trk K+ transport system NAD-binding subunit
MGNHTPNRSRDAWRAFTAWLRTVRAAIRRVRLPLAVLLLVMTAGTLTFWLSAQQPSPGRAFLYTLNLVTLQTGPDVLPLQPGLQLAAFGVMLGGVLAVAGGAANLIAYIRDPRQQQMALASTFSNHIIVCGVGRVGYRVISELSELGDAVVAINRTESEEWVDVMRRAGVPVIIGDARQRNTLIDAGVERASALVSCTSDDLTNLDVALDAREINPEIKIVLRMFDQKLAEKIARGFNIKTTFSVSALAAPALAAAATRTKVNYSFKLDGNLLNVVSIKFEPASRFIGMSVKELEDATHCSVIGFDNASGTATPKMAMNPPHDYIIRSGDRLHIVGPLEGVRMFTA